jgi:hypothetical protein
MLIFSGPIPERCTVELRSEPGRPQPPVEYQVTNNLPVTVAMLIVESSDVDDCLELLRGRKAVGK